MKINILYLILTQIFAFSQKLTLTVTDVYTIVQINQAEKLPSKEIDEVGNY